MKTTGTKTNYKNDDSCKAPHITPLNRNLEALARQLYDYWFVQFDFPNEYGRPYKSSGGKMVWNDYMKREIPETWSVEPLANWLNIKSGYPFKSNSYLIEGDFKIITIKNVQDGYIDTTDCSFLNEIPNEAKQWIALSIGDCLISLTGNCGRVGLVTEPNLLLNQRVGLIDCLREMKLYVYFLFLSEHMKRLCETLSNGAAQANLSPIDLCKTIDICPAKSVIENFNEIAYPYIDNYISNCQEIRMLIKQRDELLPLLMNGQVSVMPTVVNCDLYHSCHIDAVLTQYQIIPFVA